jgi:hypothetical protein
LNKVTTTIIQLICVLTLVSSCGYFKDSPVDKSEVYVADNVGLTCELDTDSFSKLLDEDIEEQIKCLERNFRQYMDLVETEKVGAIGKKELSNFVKKFFSSNSDAIIGGLGILFELNMILLKDEAQFISADNITPLFRLLIAANKEAIHITHYLDLISENKDADAAVWEHRKKLRKSLENLAQATLKIAKSSKKVRRRLNIRKFLNDIINNFDSVSITQSNINSFTYAKKLFTGGDKNWITTDEIFNLIEKIPDLAMAAIDLVFIGKENFVRDSEYYLFHRKTFQALGNVLQEQGAEEVILTRDQIFDVADQINNEDFDLKKYEQLIDSTKVHFLGGGKKNYTYGNFKRVVSLAQVLFYGLSFKEEYDARKDLLETSTSTKLEEQKEDVVSILKEHLKGIYQVLRENPDALPENFDYLTWFEEVRQNVQDQFEFDLTENFTTEHLKAYSGFKRLLLGGQKDSITNEQIKEFIKKGGSLVELVLDVTLNFPSADRELWSMAFKDLMIFKKLVFYKESIDPISILDGEDITLLLSMFLEKPDDVDESEASTWTSKFLVTIKNFKKRIFNSSDPGISLDDVMDVIDFAEEGLARALFASIAYPLHEDQLSKTSSIKLTYRDSKDFAVFDQKKLLKYWVDFKFAAENHRFYRHEEKSVQYLTEEIYRSEKGLTELLLLRWVSKKLVAGWGSPDPSVDPRIAQYRISFSQMDTVLYEFKAALEYFGLWSANPVNFARNTVLLGDLFQKYSDGDNHLQAEEAAEYFSLVFSAIYAADDIIDQIKLKCKWITAKGEEGFPVTCYRKYLFSSMFKKGGYSKFFPKWKAYLDKVGKEEAQNFLVNVEGFAREVNEPDRPMTRKDMLLLIGAMLNIESTIIRFDVNGNNIVDPDELAQAYNLYENSIIQVANLSADQEKYTNSIFLYMVEKLELPSIDDLSGTASFLTFHLFYPKDDIVARRLNIGAILYFLVNQ